MVELTGEGKYRPPFRQERRKLHHNFTAKAISSFGPRRLVADRRLTNDRIKLPTKRNVRDDSDELRQSLSKQFL
jgi:hypothetical protein